MGVQPTERIKRQSHLVDTTSLDPGHLPTSNKTTTHDQQATTRRRKETLKTMKANAVLNLSLCLFLLFLSTYPASVSGSREKISLPPDLKQELATGSSLIGRPLKEDLLLGAHYKANLEAAFEEAFWGRHLLGRLKKAGKKLNRKVKRARRGPANKVARGVQNVGRVQTLAGATAAAAGAATGNQQLASAGMDHVKTGAKRAVGGGIVKRATEPVIGRRLQEDLTHFEFEEPSLGRQLQGRMKRRLRRAGRRAGGLGRRGTVNRIARGVQNVGRAQALAGATAAAAGAATGNQQLTSAGMDHVKTGAKRAVGGGIVKRSTRPLLRRRISG